NEIDLTQTGTSGTGTIVTLRKTSRQFNGCTIDGITGTFGFGAAGVSSVPSPSGGAAVSTAFSSFGRIDADGAGNFVQDNVGAASPLTQRQFTGTYTVNPDCTGTGTLVAPDKTTRKINFVIVNVGSAQALVFSYADTGVVGSGLGQQQ